jgi:hypothetical protein
VDITKLESGGYVVLMSQQELDVLYVAVSGSDATDRKQWAELGSVVIESIEAYSAGTHELHMAMRPHRTRLNE